MPLTPKQVDAVVALDWLLDNGDGSRRQGRTTALAVALIRQALRRPGQRIGYMDHLHAMPSESMHGRGELIMRQIVGGLVHADPVLRTYGWDLAQHSFKAVLVNPVFTWWPDPSLFEGDLPLADDDGPVPTCWDRLTDDPV